MLVRTDGGGVGYINMRCDLPAACCARPCPRPPLRVVTVILNTSIDLTMHRT